MADLGSDLFSPLPQLRAFLEGGQAPPCPGLREAEVLYWGAGGLGEPQTEPRAAPANPGSRESPPFVHTSFSSGLVARASFEASPRLGNQVAGREGGLSNLEVRHPQEGRSVSQMREKRDRPLAAPASSPGVRASG